MARIADDPVAWAAAFGKPGRGACRSAPLPACGTVAWRAARAAAPPVVPGAYDPARLAIAAPVPAASDGVGRWMPEWTARAGRGMAIAFRAVGRASPVAGEVRRWSLIRRGGTCRAAPVPPVVAQPANGAADLRGLSARPGARGSRGRMPTGARAGNPLPGPVIRNAAMQPVASPDDAHPSRRPRSGPLSEARPLEGGGAAHLALSHGEPGADHVARQARDCDLSKAGSGRCRAVATQSPLPEDRPGDDPGKPAMTSAAPCQTSRNPVGEKDTLQGRPGPALGNAEAACFLWCGKRGSRLRAGWHWSRARPAMVRRRRAGCRRYRCRDGLGIARPCLGVALGCRPDRAGPRGSRADPGQIRAMTRVAGSSAPRRAAGAKTAATAACATGPRGGAETAPGRARMAPGSGRAAFRRGASRAGRAPGSARAVAAPSPPPATALRGEPAAMTGRMRPAGEPALTTRAVCPRSHHPAAGRRRTRFG